jgi:hypothetical protein
LENQFGKGLKKRVENFVGFHGLLKTLAWLKYYETSFYAIADETFHFTKIKKKDNLDKDSP